MPLDDRCRLDQDHGAQAARPEPVEPDPEEAIDREEPRTAAPLSLENHQLMAQGDDLQLQGGAAAKATAEQRPEGGEKGEHPANATATSQRILGFRWCTEF